jgi:hypothetical protein
MAQVEHPVFGIDGGTVLTNAQQRSNAGAKRFDTMFSRFEVQSAVTNRTNCKSGIPGSDIQLGHGGDYGWPARSVNGIEQERVLRW